MKKLKTLRTKNFFRSQKIFSKEKIKKISLINENIELKIDDQILDSYIKSSFATKKINGLDDYKKLINSLELDFEYMKEKLIIDIL